MFENKQQEKMIYNGARIVVLKTSIQTIKRCFCSFFLNQAHELCFFFPLFFFIILV